VFDRNVVGPGEDLSCGGHVFALQVHALEDAAHEVGNDVRAVVVEIVAHGPHVGDQVVRAAGGHDEPGAGHLIGNRVNVRRPADEGLEGRVLDKNFRGGRC